MSDPQNPTAQTQSKEATLESRYLAEKEFMDKHGYYYSVLSDEDKIAYRLAAQSKGLDDEIALLRLKTRDALVLYPYNLNMFVRFINLIVRLQRLQRALSKKDGDSKLETATEKAFDPFASLSALAGPRLSSIPGTA